MIVGIIVAAVIIAFEAAAMIRGGKRETQSEDGSDTNGFYGHHF